eukprot:5778904-Alexandrium_andersonii.AAC.1
MYARMQTAVILGFSCAFLPSTGLACAFYFAYRIWKRPRRHLAPRRFAPTVSPRALPRPALRNLHGS